MEHIDTAPAGDTHLLTPEEALSRRAAAEERTWKRKAGRPILPATLAPGWPAARRIHLRALLFARESITLTQPQIARKYGVSHDSVKRALSYAKRAEIFTDLEDKLLGGLAVKAEQVLDAAMAENIDGTRNDGKAEPLPSKRASAIAAKVLEGVGALRKAGQKSPSDPSGAQESELTKYIQQRRAKALEQENTHDGAIVDTQPHLGEPSGAAEPLALPPGPSERDPEPPRGGPRISRGLDAPDVSGDERDPQGA